MTFEKPHFDGTMEKIGALKKITISFRVQGEADSQDLQPSSIFEFVFGIGTRGLTPFEYQLANKKEGDTFSFQLKKADIPHFFQHLIGPGLPTTDDIHPLCIKGEVIKVSQADQREVIKALAEIARCGDHCCGHEL